MKKSLFIFVILATIALIAGCSIKSKNTVRFNPDRKETTTTEDKEVKQDDKRTVTVEEIKEDQPAGVLAVTSPKEKKIDSEKGYHVIRGTAPKGTAKIMVNDYTLHKYNAGERLWSFIASTGADNLKTGDNTYTVKALDKEGKELGIDTFTIAYNPVAPKLPLVGMPNSSLFTYLMLSGLIAAAFTFTRKKAY